MNNINWRCPKCERHAVIHANDMSEGFAFQDAHMNRGTRRVSVLIIRCPNLQCGEFTISSAIDHGKRDSNGYYTVVSKLKNSRLWPEGVGMVLPAYIPEPIAEDYLEACLIQELSPKASATLARRCLQGMIRDFHQISMKRLVDEIDALKGKIDQETWDGIDALRQVGNIGAHMESDINVIVDVDPDEAKDLIRLLEILFRDWYIARHNRRESLKTVSAIAAAKKVDKQAQKAAIAAPSATTPPTPPSTP